MAISQVNYYNPLRVDDGNVWYGLEGEAQPMSPMFNPDGTLTMTATFSVGDLWYGKSGIDSEKSMLRNIAPLPHEICMRLPSGVLGV